MFPQSMASQQSTLAPLAHLLSGHSSSAEGPPPQLDLPMMVSPAWHCPLQSPQMPPSSGVPRKVHLLVDPFGQQTGTPW